MRNSLLFLLLASAAVPAFAAGDDSEDRAARREAAIAEREARSERQSERSQQPQPSQQPQRSQAEPRARFVEPDAGDRPAVREQRREVVQQQVIERRPAGGGGDSPRPTLGQRREMVDSVGGWRARERRAENSPAVIEQGNAGDSVRQWRARERRVENGPAMIEQRAGSIGEPLQQRRPRRVESGDAIGNRRLPAIRRIPREGSEPPTRAIARPSDLSASRWRHNWRTDNRYDWRNHRRRHRSLFRFGFYYDPFGWRYRPYSIGSRLWPSYYRSSYWLNDPWMYRLPMAYPPYRWVRYYDDALLIDTWSGEVVDVIHNFFW